MLALPTFWVGLVRALDAQQRLKLCCAARHLYGWLASWSLTGCWIQCWLLQLQRLPCQLLLWARDCKAATKGHSTMRPVTSSATVCTVSKCESCASIVEQSQAHWMLPQLHIAELTQHYGVAVAAQWCSTLLARALLTARIWAFALSARFAHLQPTDAAVPVHAYNLIPALVAAGLPAAGAGCPILLH